MKQVFFTAAECAKVLGCHERSFRRIAEKKGWQKLSDKARKRKSSGAGRPQWEFHYTLFDQELQARLVVQFGSAVNDAKSKDQKQLWQAFETAPRKQKEAAQDRLNIIAEIHQLMSDAGLNETAATAFVSNQRNVSSASIWNWKSQLKGVNRSDWLAALLPQYVSRTKRADIHPDAWDWFVSDYLRPEKPKITACYRRLVEQSGKRKWGTIPHERSLRRRLEAEVPRAVRIMKREGRDKAKTLLPAQRRTVEGLHAMQAVNMDGHRFDVFVKWKGHDKPVRPMLIALQDVYSRKFVAWRLDDSENKETVRLVIGDMVEQWGIPDVITMDNGRAFASKWISGGFANRFRFKVNETDPDGLLLKLGIDVHWAQPGHGQAKPIERAFGDLAEAISKHPLCAGAYTGNNPLAKPDSYGTKVVDQDVFKALVDHEIAAHNARQGRRTEMANGRSFDDAFAESYENAIVRWPTQAQKSFWLMAADKIRCQRGSGEIHFERNRYWHEALNQYAGKQVIIRFDPDNLHQPIRVYDASDAFICDADNIADVGFYDKREARLHARDLKTLLKATRDKANMIAKIDAAELGRLSEAGKLEPASKKSPEKPKVQRLATPLKTHGSALPKVQYEAEPDDEINIEASFEKGLRIIHGGLDDD
jgi:transposase InsO family protein